MSRVYVVLEEIPWEGCYTRAAFPSRQRAHERAAQMSRTQGLGHDFLVECWEAERLVSTDTFPGQSENLSASVGSDGEA